MAIKNILNVDITKFSLKYYRYKQKSPTTLHEQCIKLIMPNKTKNEINKEKKEF